MSCREFSFNWIKNIFSNPLIILMIVPWALFKLFLNYICQSKTGVNRGDSTVSMAALRHCVKETAHILIVAYILFSFVTWNLSKLRFSCSLSPEQQYKYEPCTCYPFPLELLFFPQPFPIFQDILNIKIRICPFLTFWMLCVPAVSVLSCDWSMASCALLLIKNGVCKFLDDLW